MKTILVIDDSFSWRTLLSWELTAEGYAVSVAKDIHDAIESDIDFSKVDLIVIDLHAKIPFNEVSLINKVMIDNNIKLIIYGRTGNLPSRFNEIREKIIHNKHLVKQGDLDELKNEIKILLK